MKLGLQYEPENLDVNKSVLLSNWISLVSIKNQDFKP